jgi:hypothetical protein
MSEKYPGGLITKTPVTPAGPYQTGAASGVWTRDQQLQYQQQGIWPTAGLTPPYIEDVFSTYLYTGTGAAQTITNNIDLSGKGGLVWAKVRNDGNYHALFDTNRGVLKRIQSDTTNQEATVGGSLTSFNSNGFGIDYNGNINGSGLNYVSWTFRKQPKFFDVVTYTGDANSGRTVAHNLGSVPGCIIFKRTDSTSNWFALCKNGTNYEILFLNTTDATYGQVSISSCATSTVLNIGYITSQVGPLNTSGATYVAYLYANNAGGFGSAGTDNVITCGTCTANGSGDFSATLGWEPQWILIKSTGSGLWSIFDNMRGITASSGYTSSQRLQAQSSAAEDTLNSGYGLGINSTGFTGNLATFSNDFIYIAIRRGPMKTPTTGTSVFDIQQYTGTQSSSPGTARNITTTIRSDVNITSAKTPGSDIGVFFDRLRGCNKYIGSNGTNSEGTMPGSAAYEFWNNKYILGGYYLDYTGYNYVNYSLQRAPGFFDEVCYTGTGSATTITHNLGVAPEMVIVKSRSDTYSWPTLVTAIGGNGFLFLDSTTSTNTSSAYFNNTYPTSTVFSVGTNAQTNGSGSTFVAYLFATLAGVSKVGGYTGTGALTTINCGFTGGARFVMIKRTNATGNWYFWDTSRGMVSGTDPSLAFNTFSAQSNADSMYTATTGFQLLASPAVDVNTNGGTYIFLAIA